MLPDGDSFSSLNIFSRYRNTRKNRRSKHAEPSLSLDATGNCHTSDERKVRRQRDGLLGATPGPLAFSVAHEGFETAPKIQQHMNLVGR